MAIHRIEIGTAARDEHAAVFVPAGKRSAHLRPSNPLVQGVRVSRVVTTIHARDGRTVTYTTAFRNPDHAAAWLALIGA